MSRPPLIDPQQLFQGTAFHIDGSPQETSKSLTLKQKLLILKVLTLLPVIAIITLAALSSSVRYKMFISPQTLAITLIGLTVLHFVINCIRLRMVKKENEWIMAINVLCIMNILVAAITLLINPTLIKGRVKDALHFASAYLTAAIVIPIFSNCLARKRQLAASF
jgi:hypothetical protein